jgi:hypothetical protein
MERQPMTRNELRQAGIAALIKALGPVDAQRFLMQFEHGSGDYTAECETIVGDPSLDEIAAALAQRRSGDSA